jgi:hypothetical protein
MAGERTPARRSETARAREPAWTLEDVLAQPCPDANDDLPHDQWVTENAELAGRVADVANRLRRSTPMRTSKKQAAFLQAAVDAGTDEPLLVKFLAAKARVGTRTFENDSDAKRVAKQLSTGNGSPLYRTPAGLILETTRRKAPSGVSWHNLTDLQRQLLVGLSHEAVACALMQRSSRALTRIRELRGIGGPTIAKLAGVPYGPNVAKLFRDMVDLNLLSRPTPRSLGAGIWPTDAPFKPHPFLRKEQQPPLRHSELRRQLQEREAQRNALQVAFRATHRMGRGMASESAL